MKEFGAIRACPNRVHVIGPSGRLSAKSKSLLILLFTLLRKYSQNLPDHSDKKSAVSMRGCLDRTKKHGENPLPPVDSLSFPKKMN